MWNPNRAPQASFEKLAKRVGIHKARRIWEGHKERLRIHHALAAKQEEEAAAKRFKAGPAVLKHDDIRPMGHFAPITYKELHRSTLGQADCIGGEVFDDEEYMRDFLKRHPECAPRKYVTGDIRSGWTSGLERAAFQGKMERALHHMSINHRLQAASAEGAAARGQSHIIAA